MEKKILSIGITSYKRIKELIRCIESIETKYINEIEIIISEDHSPLRKEIKDAVKNISQKSKYTIIFNSNQQNLGYDRNLKKLIELCNGEYIMLLSDDDMVTKKAIDCLVETIKNIDVGGLILSPFIYNNGQYDRKHSKSKFIPNSENSVKKYIYDAILFSGLVFKSDYVKMISAEQFVNYNYFQVYLVCKMLYQYGGYYMDEATVVCMGDGENAYGIAESSGGNEILADRKSVLSNLEFNKTLIKTIKIFDDEMKTNIIKSFERQYSFHCYSGLSIARKEGIQYFKQYWKILNNLEIHLLFISKIYYVLLLILGRDKSDRILLGIRNIREKYRKLLG